MGQNSRQLSRTFGVTSFDEDHPYGATRDATRGILFPAVAPSTAIAGPADTTSREASLAK
jgi:hypothetical protein